MWYKAWLETRMTYALLMLFTLFIAFAYIYDGPESAQQWHHRMMNPLFLAFSGAFVALSGSGMSFLSEARLKPTKSPSMQYTLSFPIRRRKLMAIRSIVGGLQAASAVVVCCSLLWTFAPTLRDSKTPGEFALYALSVIFGSSVIFAVGVLAGTFLGEIWRFYATAFAFAVMMTARIQAAKLPEENFWRKAANLLMPVAADHPWWSMLLCLTLAACIWYGAVRLFEPTDF